MRTIRMAKAKEAADKAAAEAAAKAKTAAEAQVVADKAAVDAAAKAKTTAEAKAAADKAAVEAAAKSKAAVDLKTVADKRATDTTAAAAPKDVALFWPSTTATLKITAAPITLTVTPPAAAVNKGRQVEIPVALDTTLRLCRCDRVGSCGTCRSRRAVTIAVAAGAERRKACDRGRGRCHARQPQSGRKAIATFNGQKLPADQVVPIVVEKVEKK